MGLIIFKETNVLFHQRTHFVFNLVSETLMYKLYNFPYSQHSRRVVSLLEQVGIDYDSHVVDMMNGEHMSSDYLAVNPNHQIPTLIDGDVKIHESHAIMRYLCVKHALVAWYPRTGDAFAKVEQWLDWIQCQLSQLVVDIVLNSVFLGEHGDKEAVDKAKNVIPAKFKILENQLATTAYLTGDKPTIADLSLASIMFHLNFANAMPKTPNISRWYEDMAALPGFQKSLPET